MKKDAATPLVAVRRKQKGFRDQQVGSIATSPKEVDSIIRKEYGAIYKGNGIKGEDPETFAERVHEGIQEVHIPTTRNGD